MKRTRTRTRAMMTAISDKIKSVDQVFIVGHRNLDMDALGASVGMQFSLAIFWLPLMWSMTRMQWLVIFQEQLRN